MVRVRNKQGYGRTYRLTTHDATQNTDGVFFDLHPPTGTVTLLTAGEFDIDDGCVQRQSSRHAIQYRSHCRAM
jgi:hypothetical protein